MPASHDLHACVEELYHLPAPQGTHDEAPDKVNVLVTLPGLHTRHEEEPLLEKLPNGHDRHAEIDVWPDDGLKVPASHD